MLLEPSLDFNNGYLSVTKCYSSVAWISWKMLLICNLRFTKCYISVTKFYFYVNWGVLNVTGQQL